MRTRGVELELTAKPFNALLLESSLAYVDAKITSYKGAGCYLGRRWRWAALRSAVALCKT